MPHEKAGEAARWSRWAEAAGLVLVLAAGVYVYRGFSAGFFVQDDFGWLEESRFESVRDWLGAFFRFNPALTYRPLSQETFFFLARSLFGLWPPGFHYLSLAFHLLGGVLLYRLAREFFQPLPSLTATLFYVAHNAHFRSVYWISAIPEPIALVFYLASLLLFVRFDRTGRRSLLVGSWAAMGLGVMSKESILSLPLVLVAYCLLFSRRRLPWTFPFLGLSALYVGLRAVSRAVQASPYPLTFGVEAWQNLLAYLSWTAGFSETLLKLKLGWDAAGSHPWLAALFLVAVTAAIAVSRDRKAALFCVAWFVLALQPVLYFSQHIFSYYLAPSLAAVSILLASALPRLRHVFDARAWIPALALGGFFLWSAEASIKREGRWWDERTWMVRSILEQMEDVDRSVPPGRRAYLFGFGESDLGAMQNDAALKAYGYPPDRFILVGLDPRTHDQIEHLEKHEGLGDYHCFLYSGGRLLDQTAEFRQNPDSFLLLQPLEQLDVSPSGFIDRPDVRLVASSGELRAGIDTLTLQVVNLDVPAIDVLYTYNGSLMRAVTGWRLDGDGRASVFVAPDTPRGVYHYRAIRDSREKKGTGWIRVDVRFTIR